MTWAMEGIGTALGGVATAQGGRANAGLLESQAITTQNQALRDEEAQRRESRQNMGRLAASMAQAGGGVDEGITRQSSLAGELDALNIRYAGQMRAAGLAEQAKQMRRQSKLLAGASLLKAGGELYSGYKLSH